MTEKQLEEKAEDDFDFDEDDFMKEYRAKKMAEMKEEAAKPKFRGCIEINKQQWDEHVTRAPADTPVVIVLY